MNGGDGSETTYTTDFGLLTASGTTNLKVGGAYFQSFQYGISFFYCTAEGASGFNGCRSQKLPNSTV